MVHGNQGGRRTGASALVGSLERLCARWAVTAAAVSQPGFGTSDGPADFCGPATQAAIATALAFLRAQPQVDPARIILYGHSRGAVAAAVAATRDPALFAVVLSGGVYDLAAFYVEASLGLRRSIAREAGTSPEAFAARSALTRAAEFRAETLLLHGLHDDRAPIAQAERLAQAIAAAGHATATLRRLDCGHDIPRALQAEALEPLLRRQRGTVH